MGVTLVAARAASAEASREARRSAWRARRSAREAARDWASPAGPDPVWLLYLGWYVQYAFGLVLKALGLYARGVRNALAIGLTRFELAFRDLPAAFEGYRILQLSDAHFDTLPELAAAAGRLLGGLEVDLVIMTGDFRGGIAGPFEAALAPFGPLLGAIRSRDGCLAVLGNHDPAAIVEPLEALGIRVLVNESMVLERGGAGFVVTGLDDVHQFYTEAARAALAEAPAGFKLALVHSAEAADFAAEAGYRLYLCGHTHGGQVCWPGGRAIVTHLKRCGFGAAGLWRYGAMTGYTSRGLGVARPPVRFNCRGEATLITLRREPR